MRTWYILPWLLLLAVASAPAADVPGIIAYQGRIATGAGPFTGTGSFKFALVDQAGTTTWWSNDGTSVAGAEPTGAVLLGVQGGLFAVLLGDPGHAGMTEVVSPAVFSNDAVFLRIWFSAAGTPGSFELLAPDRRLASAGYAFLAQSVADGAIGDAQVSTLAWSKLTGVPALVRDGGTTPGIASGAADPVAAPATGLGSLYIATTSQRIFRWDGSAWQLIAAVTAASGTLAGDVTGALDSTTIAATAGTGDRAMAAVNLGSATIDAARIGTGLTDAQVADALTVSGGTVDGTPIGGTTPAAVAATTLTATTELVLPETANSPVAPAAGSLRYDAASKIVEFWEPTANAGSGAWVPVNTYAP